MPSGKRYSATELRRCVWRTLTIMRSIVVTDLVATIHGVGIDTARKSLRQLEIHGYITKSGVYRGAYSVYVKLRLIKLLPPVCEYCNQPFTAHTCPPNDERRAQEKEREEEKENADWQSSNAGEALSQLEGGKEKHHDAA